ncbi:uncharacterized protein B0P05DRAFT_476523, partial [Gilbertella persicaria]|uniref:uncharacterized protein n=1 Tax=Gilbertella persicaria TaxID=101096 RepID=UPI00221EAED2
FLLNKLLTKKPHSSSHSSCWHIRWPAICTILHGMDYLAHSTVPPPPQDPGSLLLNWLFLPSTSP